MAAKDYPPWVCEPCGKQYGRRLPHAATWHEGTCGVCNRNANVTEPRDFGHLDEAWRDDEEKWTCPECKRITESAWSRCDDCVTVD